MKAVTAAIVVIGLGLAVLLGVARGFDPTSLTILVLLAVVGALAIAVARRSERATVAPATCAECDGVISPNAPYCKHCGARTSEG